MTDQEKIAFLESKIKTLHEGYRAQLLNLEKFKAMVMNLNQGIMVVDNDDVITKVYESFENLSGYKESELLGKKAKEVFLKKNDLMSTLQFQEQNQYRNTGESSAYEMPILKKNGEELWVSISGAPIFDNSGQKVGSIGIHYDISRQKRLQKALQEAREESDKAKHAEERFLAKMSHEIRTPLNAVIGMSYLLKGTNINQEQQEYVDVISRSGNLLLNLINDILDYSKISSGNIQVRPVVCSLSTVLQDMAQTFRLKTQDKPFEIISDFDIEHDVVKADITLLNQILMNLLGNSEKFTEHGSITLKAEPLAEFDKTVTYQFSIIDTGTGIAPERIDAIFQEFVQEEGVVLKDFNGGTGLGLAITKKIIEMMGGKIWAESTVGVGTQMIFVLTFELTNDNFQPEEHVKNVQHKHTEHREIDNNLEVLIAEDNAMNQKYISRILEKIDVSFEIASDGQVASQKCKDRQYDVIFMDLFMPKVDGFEATKEVRNDEKSKNHETPIYALTATAVQQHKERALKVGMNGFISKPFHPNEILSVLKEVSKKSTPQPLINEPMEPIKYAYAQEFDTTTLDMYYGEDISYALEMFEIFSEQLKESIPEIQVALSTSNRIGLRHLVHKLKPTFTMVGFPSLTQYFEKWEQDLDQPNLSFELFPGVWEDINPKVMETLNLVDKEIIKMKDLPGK